MVSEVLRITLKVMGQVVQKQVQTIEVENPLTIQKTVQRKKPIIQEQVTQVQKIVEEVVPVVR